jgi:hypothetical protein
MKKLFFLIIFCLIAVVFFVNDTFNRVYINNDNDVSIKINETDDIYQLRAHYGEWKTDKVRRYMNERLHTNNRFRNATMDADVTLDDKTSFYIRTSSGRLFIKVNRNQNDPEAFERVKQFGEDLKNELADN